MPRLDPRVDEYIARAPEFARPILQHLRRIVHDACPDVEEKMKWSVPHFDYGGPLANMAAFKQHCGFGFWKGTLFLEGAGEEADRSAGHFGRIRSVADLPPAEVLKGHVRRAMELNDQVVKSPPRKAAPKPEAETPGELGAALRANPAALAAFEAFAPGQRREYAAWIAEAKSDATRTKRIETAIEWIAEGKPRHWKYRKQLVALDGALPAREAWSLPFPGRDTACFAA